MTIVAWDEEKNLELQKKRNISFELIASLIEQEKILDIIQNPGQKYKHQGAYILEINSYTYVVPFVKNEGHVFLKTAFPHRGMHKKYSNKERLT